MDPAAQEAKQDASEKNDPGALPDQAVPKGVEDTSSEQQKRWPKGRFGISQEIREQRPSSQSSDEQTPPQQSEPPDWRHRDQRSENHREERYTHSNPYVDWEPGRSPPAQANHGEKKGDSQQGHIARNRSGGEQRRRNPHREKSNHPNSKASVPSRRRRSPGPNAQSSRRTDNQRPPR